MRESANEITDALVVDDAGRRHRIDRCPKLEVVEEVMDLTNCPNRIYPDETVILDTVKLAAHETRDQ